MQPYKAKRGTRLLTVKPNKPITRGLRPSYAEVDSVSFTTATSSLLSSEEESKDSINDDDDDGDDDEEEEDEEEDDDDESDYSGCSGAQKAGSSAQRQAKRHKPSSHPAPAATKARRSVSRSRNNDPSPEAATHKLSAPSRLQVSSRALTIMEELSLKLACPNSNNSDASKAPSSRSKTGPLLLLPPCIPSIQHEAFTFEPSSALLLGRGNYGSVHEGCYQGRRVAVKVQPLDEDDPDDFHELSTEALFGACLSHPGLLKTHAAQFINREIVIITDIMSIGSVLQAFTGRPLASSANLLMALSIGEQVAWALHHLHSLDLVHLDVKGANVLVDGSMREGGVRAALCDFGLVMRVKDIKQHRRTSQAASINIRDRGTLRYMGAEYFDESLGSIGTSSDVYALGCVLIEMASGGRAFLSDKSDAAVTKLKGKVEVPWSSGNSPVLDSFLKLSAQCRSVKPGSRPDAKTVALALKSMSAKIR
jgi:hypothetical protein